jgi:hypothetical protein
MNTQIMTPRPGPEVPFAPPSRQLAKKLCDFRAGAGR